ncbi:hypothetical protein CCACVL1_18869 [Corchorus capsularis]|uniref:ARID domain-containing protein n=1 Tax=Corchorus capsularis TaxID=210143 RepID=A0A1R3HJM3_COCAP|nr:hypothetical protein CCACVL1_18869 [Corchorus capsularis]
MAGWSLTTDVSSLDCAKTLENLRHSWANLEPFSEGSLSESEHDKFRFSFSKILQSFLREICAQGWFWPLPPMLGDGKSMDLLKLFLVAREKGGYDVVSGSGLWDLVTKKSDLGLGLASSVKLVYVKYLVLLEKWLEGIVDYKQLKSESSYNNHLMELGDDLKGVLEDSVDDVKILESNDIKEKFSSLKRKRDSTWGMLNWVTEIGKDQYDPVIGSLPDRSRWKSYGSEEFWKQILLFREVAFLKKDDQKMHQTKFGYNLRERSSCSKKHRHDYSSGNHSDLDIYMVGIDDYCAVPIGPLFQAEVPTWTGVASESDAKWLGTRVWPLGKKEVRNLVEVDRIGKGRQDSCGCPLQGSIECVKFHIAERRRKVKLELGSAFNQWKFDKMEEEIATL